MIPYSEKYAWEHGQYNPLLNALAQYYKSERSWVFIQAFTGGVDGMRSLRTLLWCVGIWIDVPNGPVRIG